MRARTRLIVRRLSEPRRARQVARTGRPYRRQAPCLAFQTADLTHAFLALILIGAIVLVGALLLVA